MMGDTPSSRANFLLVAALVLTWAIQMAFFAIANTFKFDKVTDLAGALNFVVLAWFTYGMGGTFHIRQTIVCVFVTVWGVRLGSYLLVRVLRRGKDERFDELRKKCCSFFAFWVIQASWVWIVSLPVIYLNAAAVDVPLGTMDFAGFGVWFVGVVVEAVADHTKDSHMSSPSRSELLDHSVWHVSRHPNYFGEILTWWGVFMCAASTFSVNTNAGFASAASPLFTMLLLVGVSGIPMGEKRYDLRYKDNDKYWEYKRRTSPLIPFPPILYRPLPKAIKLLLCFECPCYWTQSEQVPITIDSSTQESYTPPGRTKQEFVVPENVTGVGQGDPTVLVVGENVP